MISKLILCYELSLDQLQNSISYLTKTLNAQEILCLRIDELSLVNLEDYQIYCFHLDLQNELQTHNKVSDWLLENDYCLLNPYLLNGNIFDDKFLFSQFLLANEIKHPETFLNSDYDKKYENSYVVKARHGTEKKDFDIYSKDAVNKISIYDDVLVQEKLEIDDELKVLFLDGKLYATHDLEIELLIKVNELIALVKEYVQLKDSQVVKIFSVDIIKDKLGEYYFIELNLRPGALYRFKEQISL